MDIDGYTDSQGSDELNQTLSENRAKSVKDYLVSKGIDESRLKSTGYGETNPIADNKTAQAVLKPQNRNDHKKLLISFKLTKSSCQGKRIFLWIHCK